MSNANEMRSMVCVTIFKTQIIRESNYVVIGALASGDSVLCQRLGEQIAIYNHEAGRIEEDLPSQQDSKIYPCSCIPRGALHEWSDR